MNTATTAAMTPVRTITITASTSVKPRCMAPVRGRIRIVIVLSGAVSIIRPVGRQLIDGARWIAHLHGDELGGNSVQRRGGDGHLIHLVTRQTRKRSGSSLRVDSVAGPGEIADVEVVNRVEILPVRLSPRPCKPASRLGVVLARDLLCDR